MGNGGYSQFISGCFCCCCFLLRERSPPLFQCGMSLPQDTVLQKLIQHESFPRATVLHKLLQCWSLPWGAVLQEQAAPVWVPHRATGPATRTMGPPWASHRVTASLGIHLLQCRVLQRLQVDLWCHVGVALVPFSFNSLYLQSPWGYC